MAVVYANGMFVIVVIQKRAINAHKEQLLYIAFAYRFSLLCSCTQPDTAAIKNFGCCSATGKFGFAFARRLRESCCAFAEFDAWAVALASVWALEEGVVARDVVVVLLVGTGESAVASSSSSDDKPLPLGAAAMSSSPPSFEKYAFSSSLDDGLRSCTLRKCFLASKPRQNPLPQICWCFPNRLAEITLANTRFAKSGQLWKEMICLPDN